MLFYTTLIIMTREQRIIALLSEHLQPVFLEVLNESNNHHVPAGSETHFKITMAAAKFRELSLVERHRLINTLLAKEFKQGLHALSLHLYTPEEQKPSPQSPACRDGYRHG